MVCHCWEGQWQRGEAPDCIVIAVWKEMYSASFAAYPIYALYSPGSLRRLRFSDSYSWEVDLNTEEIGAES